MEVLLIPLFTGNRHLHSKATAVEQAGTNGDTVFIHDDS